MLSRGAEEARSERGHAGQQPVSSSWVLLPVPHHTPPKSQWLVNLAAFRWYFCRRGFPRALQDACEAPHCIERLGHKQEVLSKKSDSGIILQTKQFSEKSFKRLLKSCGNWCTIKSFIVFDKGLFYCVLPVTELTEGRNENSVLSS